MAKKRTGLQSNIAGIFSGVPIPKKGQQRSKSGSPSKKPDEPPSKTGGPVIPKPMAPKPVTQKPIAPVKRIPERKVEPIPAISQPGVADVKVAGQEKVRAPRKVSRRQKDRFFAPKAAVSSSRQKAGIILFVVLLTALVIVLARPYLTSQKNSAVSRTAAKTDADNPTGANIEIDWPMPQVYSADIPDPMQLSPEKPERVKTANDLVVRGISYSEDRRYAVIGTQTMQEGDTILGATIVEITPSSVVFEKDGKRWIQKVESEGK